MNPYRKPAIILCSGGADSACCLAWMVQNTNLHPIMLTFWYGQKHEREIIAAHQMADIVSNELKETVEGETIDVKGVFAGSQSSLVAHDRDITPGENGFLPSTFVPGRNLVFLGIAWARAITYGAENIVTGVCQTDYSGYPDCRKGSIDSLQNALRIGTEKDLTIFTPLMFKTKAESIRDYDSPLLRELLKVSWSCYQGGDRPCGECPSCKLRARGFEEAGFPDPAL